MDRPDSGIDLVGRCESAVAVSGRLLSSGKLLERLHPCQVVVAVLGDRHCSMRLGQSSIGLAAEPQAARHDPGDRRPLSSDRHTRGLVSELVENGQRFLWAAELTQDLGPQPVRPGTADEIVRGSVEQLLDGRIGSEQLGAVVFYVGDLPLPVNEQQTVGEVGQLPRDLIHVAESFSGGQRSSSCSSARS